MKNQVDVLRSKGLPAAALDSSIGVEESRLIKQGIKDGSLKILYVAPERLDNEGLAVQAFLFALYLTLGQIRQESRRNEHQPARYR